MHLVIFFCGTADPGDSFLDGYDYLPTDTSVRTLFVKGCEDPEVCNSYLFPDLQGFAARFSKKLFKTNAENQLLLTTATPGALGVGVNTPEEIIMRRQASEWSKREGELIDTKWAAMSWEEQGQYDRQALWQFAQMSKKERAEARASGHIKELISDEERAEIERRYAFSQEQKDRLMQKWNITEEQAEEPISSISLVGYSRGGVTCFEMARQLEKIPSNVPLEVDVVVNQPVPGNIYALPGSNAARVADCRHLTRVKNASMSIAAYTGRVPHASGGGLAQDEPQESTSRLHRAAFSQVVPKMPAGANRELCVIPCDSHHFRRENAPGSAGEHMQMHLAKILHRRNVVSSEEVQRKTEEARAVYREQVGADTVYFPPMRQVQGFFGMSAKQAYQHLDPLHPASGLRRGMIWRENEPLMDWWNRQEKNASSFSSALTKSLVEQMNNTNTEDARQMLQLWIKADEWLILKEDSNSSRYAQVEALRNNIEQRLISHGACGKPQLLAHNRQNLAKHHYFLNHWTAASKAASWFKSAATEELDAAFKKYAEEEPGLERDHQLRDALDKWLDIKKDSSSSRYDLVVSLREQLEEVISKAYEVDLELVLGDGPEPLDLASPSV